MGNYESDEYKGRTLIVLSGGPNDRYPFKFGLSKARKILDNIDAIKEFVSDEEAKAEALKSESEDSSGEGVTEE